MSEAKQRMENAKKAAGLRPECNKDFHDWLHRAYPVEKDSFSYQDCLKAVREFLGIYRKCSSS